MSKSTRKKAGSSQASGPNVSENLRLPTKFATVLTLEEDSRSRSRRRKSEPVEQKVRELSEAELRERAAWKQVEATGKPMVFEDTLLIPEGMTFWEAVEFLPDGIREQTASAMQKKLAVVHLDLVRRQRAEILEKIAEKSEWKQYETFPYAAQMAVADMLVRQKLEMPEIPIKELIELYGGKVENPSRKDEAG